jgi:hypothetical protein
MIRSGCSKNGSMPEFVVTTRRSAAAASVDWYDYWRRSQMSFIALSKALPHFVRHSRYRPLR